MSFSILKTLYRRVTRYMISKPGHIQHLCHTQSMPSKHCRGTFDQAHVSAGRKHVTGRYEKYLELYPTLKQRSHILPVAGQKHFHQHNKNTKRNYLKRNSQRTIRNLRKMSVLIMQINQYCSQPAS